MQKICLRVMLCCLLGCVEHVKNELGEPPPDDPYKIIFQTEKISKEVGELFSVDISFEDEDGKPVKITEYSKYHRLLCVIGNGDSGRKLPVNQLLEPEKPADRALRVGGHSGDSSMAEHEGKVSDDGKTVRFENLFYTEKITGILTTTTCYYKGKNITDDSIPFEIVDNTGVTADFVVSPADGKVVVKITNGDANHDYLVFDIYLSTTDVYRREDAKKITLDAEGKGEVSLPIEQFCRIYRAKSFTVLLKASDGDNSRVVSVPC